MNDETRMLIRYVCDNDIRKAQAQAKIILKHTTTQKDAKFVESQLKKLEDSNTKFIELPYNLQNILAAEDSTFFPESRFLLRPDEEEVVERILKIREAAATLKEMHISYTPTLMLHGDSGTGKTMLAKYIAYRAGVPYLYVRFSGLINSYLGKTQENLNRIFTYAKQQPCVLCIDEIDTIAMRRGQTDDIGEMNRVVISLMQEMDQLPNDLIVVGTTNRFDQLDDAMVRRFTVTQKITPFSFTDACSLLRKFFNFASFNMTEIQVQEFVKNHFPQSVYYPNTLIKEATQYLVDSIVESAQNPDKKSGDKNSEQEESDCAVYVLLEEAPDIMGSGSSSKEVAKTNNFGKALRMLERGQGNTLVKRCRVNGKLTETIWNESQRIFE